jgi:uncharacterized protein (UPF0332 family)
MKHAKWEQWLENPNILKKDFTGYVQRKVIRKGATKIEVQGHLRKAKRNLLFSRKVIDEFKDFYEWTFISYYYAVYHSALALVALQGYKTKSHLATISILIKNYFPTHLTVKDLQILGREDIREFVELKDRREDASYSISISYEKQLAEDLAEKAIDFVSKAEQIIEKR